MNTRMSLRDDIETKLAKAQRIVSEASDDASRGIDRSRDIVDLLLAEDPEEAFVAAFEYQHAFYAASRHQGGAA